MTAVPRLEPALMNGFVADIGNVVDFHEIKYIIQLKERINKENHKENYNQNILGTSDRVYCELEQ